MKIKYSITIFVFVSYLFFTFSYYAQEKLINIWQRTPPFSLPTSEKEITDTTDILVYKNVQVPTIKIYSPSKRASNGKSIIICPGGGYRVIAYDWEGDDVAKWLNSNGYTAVILKYRLPISINLSKKEIVPFIDLQRAIRLLRYNAKKIGINPNAIGVMGFSAGGHLAATLGTHFGENFLEMRDSIDYISDRPDFMVLAYPVISFNQRIEHKGSRSALIGEDPNPSLREYFSLELHVNKNTPPCFIFHAQDDKSVPIENSLLFVDSLRKNNVPHEFHLYREGGHGFSLAIGKKTLETWKELCLKWLERY